MLPMNEFLDSNAEKMHQYLEQCCHVPGLSTYTPVPISEKHWKKAIYTINDFLEMHLDKLQTEVNSFFVEPF